MVIVQEVLVISILVQEGLIKSMLSNIMLN